LQPLLSKSLHIVRILLRTHTKLWLTEHGETGSNSHPILTST
jgi:hypothetical protein